MQNGPLNNLYFLCAGVLVGVVKCAISIDRDKMSESGVEQPAKEAASPLYLGFDFSTHQVRNSMM